MKFLAYRNAEATIKVYLPTMFEYNVGNYNALFKNNNGGQGEIFITTRPNLTVDPIFFSVLGSIYIL